MPIPTPLEHEQARVREFLRYEVFGTGPEVAFDRIAQLAQRFFNVPTVLIGFIGEDRQWFKARCGFAGEEPNLSVSFCTHATKQAEVFVGSTLRKTHGLPTTSW